MTVGTPQCLVESKFLRLSQHHVDAASLASSNNHHDVSTTAPVTTTTTMTTHTPTDIIPDWLFLDYHDTVNVLVQAPGRPGHVQIFQQTKYALDGQSSLAVVGGICEPDDASPADTARREVMEEMHVSCREFHFLGKFLTDVNRGAGWTNTFLATDCENLLAEDLGDAAQEEDDTSTQVKNWSF